MNIPDEAVEAAARAICVSAGDDPDGPCFQPDAPDEPRAWTMYQADACAALTAALPYIMEGLAREYDRKAEAHAAECRRREAAGVRVRMGEFAKSGKIRGIADDLRALAPIDAEQP